MSASSVPAIFGIFPRLKDYFASPVDASTDPVPIRIDLGYVLKNYRNDPSTSLTHPLIDGANMQACREFCDLSSQIDNAHFSSELYKFAAFVTSVAFAVFAISVCTGIVTVAFPVYISIITALCIAYLICLNRAKNASNVALEKELIRGKYIPLNRRKMADFAFIQAGLAPAVLYHAVLSDFKNRGPQDLAKKRAQLGKLFEEVVAKSPLPDVKIDAAHFHRRYVWERALSGGIIGKGQYAYSDFMNSLKVFDIECSKFPEVNEGMSGQGLVSENDHLLFKERLISGKLPRVSQFLNYVEKVARIRLQIAIIDKFALTTYPDSPNLNMVMRCKILRLEERIGQVMARQGAGASR